MAASLNFCLNKYAARLPGFVFMPSHIHLLLVIDGLWLGPCFRDFKKYTAQKAFRDLGVRDSPVWQRGYDRVTVWTETVFRLKLGYIHQNPVRAGLAAKPQDWPWSSARAYRGGLTPELSLWTEWRQ